MAVYDNNEKYDMMVCFIQSNENPQEASELYLQRLLDHSSGNSVISSYVTGSSELLVPGRVTATTNIPQGSSSAVIEPAKLLGQPDVQQISVELNSKGLISLDEKSASSWCPDIHWVRALRLSDDCHSYNIQLKLHPSYQKLSHFEKSCQLPKMILQTVRTIEPGQELLLWFSEDILAILQVAFLTPHNIQGQKKYVCTRCSALYESPNPLKLHITLNCGKWTITTLWDRLSDLMKDNSYQSTQMKELFNFTLTPDAHIIRQKSAIDLTVRNPTKVTEPAWLYRPFSEPSAFRPFQKEKTSVTPPAASTTPTSELYVQTPLYNDEAQIESLVSSLGKSRQGHICLYCGKCYSRKYGLKIHIRTHTGYKPLKCKFCNRPFGDPSNLNKHVRLHAEGNTPYKCDLCGKILVRRRDLERHLKSRHIMEMNPGMTISNSLIDDDKEDEDSRNTIN